MAEPTSQSERRMWRRQPLLQTAWICQPFRGLARANTRQRRAGSLLLLLLSRPTSRSNSSNRCRSFALSACNAAFSASSRATAPAWRCSVGGISGPVRPAPSPSRSRHNASSRRFPTHTNTPAQLTISNISIPVCSQSRCQGRLSNYANVPAMAAGGKHPGTLVAHGAFDAPTPCPRNAHSPQHCTRIPARHPGG